MFRLLKQFSVLLPLALLALFWQLAAVASQRTRFLFGSPSSIAEALWTNIVNGHFIEHILVTGSEAMLGFLLGTALGCAFGFLLLSRPGIARIAKPYALALGALPVFAIAPMMIVWFGIGLYMKVAMATFATVFVAMSQAYDGGRNVDPELIQLFELNQSPYSRTFRKLILPSSLSWVLSTLRLNIGLSLLGAFIGEFIASDRGLGYVMLKAGGLYDVPLVLAAGCCIIALAFLFNYLVGLVERNRLRITEFVAVPSQLRRSNLSRRRQT